MVTHARIRLETNDLICPTAWMRRAAARSIARIGEETDLVAWAFPDNHGHLAYAGSREAAGHTAWRVELALQAYRDTGSGPFLRRWLKTDDDYAYLWNTTRYVLKQAKHHGTLGDPFGESDSRVDTLGLRVIAPWVRARVRERLPRLTDEWVADLLGLELGELRSWAAPVEPGDGLDHLGEATQATFALSTLRGSSERLLAAKATAILACPRTIRPSAIARVLRCSTATVRRVRSGQMGPGPQRADAPFESPAVRAVAAQARWRARWEGRDANALVEPGV